MAILKDLIVTGAARILGKIYSSGGFDGDLAGTASAISYATCSTAAATAAKVATIEDNTNFVLKKGSVVVVKFAASNTASSCTLNINNTGAKSIYYNNAAYTGNSTTVCGYANRSITYIYDGTYWQWIGLGAELNDNTVPSAYCSIAGGTAAKTATCTGYVLRAKSYIQVILTNANTVAGAITLNINSKGAKPIYINGAASSASNYTLPAGTYMVYYDGSKYNFTTGACIESNDSGWLTGTPTSDVKGTFTIKYRRIGNIVDIHIWDGGTHPASKVLWNIPAGFRPDVPTDMGIVVTDDYHHSDSKYVVIRKDGTVFSDFAHTTEDAEWRIYHYCGICSS